MTAWLSGPVTTVAPGLLGAHLVSDLPEGRVVVRLTEVEAYEGGDDPGSHAFRGATARNGAMFGPAGCLYVYRHLGLHVCANVVTGEVGRASAVLLRAGEVVEGAELAWARRAARGVVRSPVDLARGPARLTVAAGLRMDMYGWGLLEPGAPVHLVRPSGGVGVVARGPRVGVSGPGGEGSTFPWRFWLAGEATVSAYRPAAPPRRRTGQTGPRARRSGGGGPSGGAGGTGGRGSDG
ncbi:DNA-3-methyladenine glycosylase [Cellulomonas bogoriensis]|uniref:Putative 3-methyladenine DNA glycosylase n=1 Tax=Cellulomonas bogoriensis 69B4 = DSM 16987 TaxID=1386082 RepID=A0A0A0BYJ2_9CELL|nr:DNA-3-methyladenine glycosylase [Cellulomonas bogoriensis]KGM13006.1 DNA-3-methyladenine glycosidase [Cellulomonas bogoriensis 69B4 = DSM 16987]